MRLLLADLLHRKHQIVATKLRKFMLVSPAFPVCITPEKGECRNELLSPLKKNKNPAGAFVLPVCDCKCAIWVVPLDQDEQWAVTGANTNHVWCATCGIFIPGGSQTVTHACNIIHMTKVNGGWCGQLKLGMVSAVLASPALRHQPHSLMLTQVAAATNDEDWGKRLYLYRVMSLNLGHLFFNPALLL